MTYYAELNEQNHIVGYYIEDFHGLEKCQSLSRYILVDEELHQHLLSLSYVEITAEPESKIYTIENKDLFVEVISKEVQLGPTLEERIAALETALMGVL